MQCTVELLQFTSYSSGTVIVTVELVNSTGSTVNTMTIGGSRSSRAANLIVSTLDVLEVGEYQCRASVDYTGTNEVYVNNPQSVLSSSRFLRGQSKSIHPIHAS